MKSLKLSSLLKSVPEIVFWYSGTNGASVTAGGIFDTELCVCGSEDLQCPSYLWQAHASASRSFARDGQRSAHAQCHPASGEDRDSDFFE